ncbi:hypothetical protein JCM16418A_31990 [Paenibacillus pini]
MKKYKIRYITSTEVPSGNKTHSYTYRDLIVHIAQENPEARPQGLYVLPYFLIPVHLLYTLTFYSY